MRRQFVDLIKSNTPPYSDTDLQRELQVTRPSVVVEIACTADVVDSRVLAILRGLYELRQFPALQIF